MERYSSRYQLQREREGPSNNPSFSSTLLDAIYRSIDREGEEELVYYRETMKKKQSNGGFRDELDMANFQRACMIEKWMEKKVSEKVVVRRRSSAVYEFERKPTSNNDQSVNFFLNSSSSSSDSSSGGLFSSSETESVNGVHVRPPQHSAISSCYNFQRPKPIRTSSVPAQPPYHGGDYASAAVYDETTNRRQKSHGGSQQKPKLDGSFGKSTKSRALKIYGDLKKIKQPISPGGRLASFLNSLFTAGAAKKAGKTRRAYGDDHRLSSPSSATTVKAANAPSACSSASSFSRSCLSKTPSSRGKSSNSLGTKRTVRFYPVSVIVDEDSQLCGHKSLPDQGNRSFEAMESAKYIRSSINEELKFQIMEKNRRVEEAARELLRNYQKKMEYAEFDYRNAHMKKDLQVFADDHGIDDDDDEDEDEDLDDCASYASSDLFELDNLSSIGMERYREELPVYETTHLDTNRAIANGLIL